MYKLGDKVVYPMHGAGTIESVEEKEILGQKKKYYVLKMPVGEMKLMVPVDNVDSIGMRNIIDSTQVYKVMKILEEKTSLEDLNWNKRFRNNMEKIKTGNIFEVAEVVRDLAHRDKEKGLSTGEKKMLSNAKQILISEIALAKDIGGIEVQEEIEGIIEKV